MKKLGQFAIGFLFCVFAWVANVILVYLVFSTTGLWFLPEAWQSYGMLVELALATVLPLTGFVFVVGAVLTGKGDELFG